MANETGFSVCIRTATNVNTVLPLLGAGFEPSLDLTYEPQSFNYSDEGGCTDAYINVTGPVLELITLASYVGRAVDIYDIHGACVWWGRIHEIRIVDGEFENTVTVDELANSVSVAYYKVTSSAETTGARTQTAYTDDATSKAQYGKHQLIAARQKLTEAEAAQEVAQLLAELKRPHYGVVTSTAGGVSATLTLRGDWFYLSRNYFADTSTIEAHLPSPDISQNFGEGSGIARVMQSFAAPAPTNVVSMRFPPFLADQVVVQIGKATEVNAGTTHPNDTLVCEIWSSDWERVGTVVSSWGQYYNAPSHGIDTTETQWAINGKLIVPGFSGVYPPYWARAGTVFRKQGGGAGTTDGEDVYLESFAGGNFTANDYKVTVTRGHNGTTKVAAGSRDHPLYVQMPKTLLATSTAINASMIPSSPAEVTFSFATPFTVDQTTRWIVIKRTRPANQAQRYGAGAYYDNGWLGYGLYQIRAYSSPTAYARGSAYLAVQNTDALTDPATMSVVGIKRVLVPTDGQIYFKVCGLRDTAQQIVNMAASQNNSFLWTGIPEGNSATKFPAWSSGVKTAAYRSGDRSVQEEIQLLLKRGTSNSRPMYCIVTPSRALQVFEEDGPGYELIWRRDGTLANSDGNELPQLPPPVGRWAITEGWGAPMSDVSTRSRFYIKDARYDCATGKLDIKPRGMPQFGQLPGVAER